MDAVVIGSSPKPFDVPEHAPASSTAKPKRPFLKRGSRKEPSALNRIHKVKSPTTPASAATKVKGPAAVTPDAPAAVPVPTRALNDVSMDISPPSKPPLAFSPPPKEVVGQDSDDFEYLETMLGLSQQSGSAPSDAKPEQEQQQHVVKPPSLNVVSPPPVAPAPAPPPSPKLVMKKDAPKLPCEYSPTGLTDRDGDGEETEDVSVQDQGSHSSVDYDDYDYHGAASAPWAPAPGPPPARDLDLASVEEEYEDSDPFVPAPAPASRKPGPAPQSLVRTADLDRREAALSTDLKHLTRLRSQMTAQMSTFTAVRDRTKKEADDMRRKCEEDCERMREDLKKEKGRWANEMCKLRAMRASNGEPSVIAGAGGGDKTAHVKEYVRTIDGLKATVVSMKDKNKEEVTRLKSNIRRLQDSLDNGKRIWTARAEEVKELKGEIERVREEGAKAVEKERRKWRAQVARLERALRENNSGGAPKEEEARERAVEEAEREVERRVERRRRRRETAAGQPSVVEGGIVDNDGSGAEVCADTVKPDATTIEVAPSAAPKPPASPLRASVDDGTEGWLRAQMEEFERRTREALKEAEEGRGYRPGLYAEEAGGDDGRDEEQDEEPENEDGGSEEEEEDHYSMQSQPAPPQAQKTTRQTASGSTITTYPNGTVKTSSLDGTVKVAFTNGDVKTTLPTAEVIYYYSASKTYHTTKPDGVEVFDFVDANQHEVHMPNGEKIITYADGTIKKVASDGTWESVFRDGVKVRGEGEHTYGKSAGITT